MDVEDSKLEREKGALVQALVSRNRPLVLAILSEHALEAQGSQHRYNLRHTPQSARVDGLPLLYVCVVQYRAMLGVLLEHGCDLFERLGEGGESGNILHFYASVCDDSTNALCLLSEAGGLLLQERDGLGRTPLDVAVEHKRIKLVELYREYGDRCDALKHAFNYSDADPSGQGVEGECEGWGGGMTGPQGNGPQLDNETMRLVLGYCVQMPAHLAPNAHSDAEEGHGNGFELPGNEYR